MPELSSACAVLPRPCHGRGRRSRIGSATYGNGDWVSFDAYDGLGDLLQVSTYPVHGNQAVKNTISFAYDPLQRVTAVTHPDGTFAQWLYTGRFLTGTIDEANTQYSYTYCSPCGALTGIAGPLGWSLGWQYDGDGDLTTFTDARGKQTTYQYGFAGELTGITYPDASGLAFLYDDNGRVRQFTNGRGQNLLLGYDNADRLLSITGQSTTSLGYNTDDTLHSVTNSNGTTTITYRADGAVSSVVYDFTASGLTALQRLDYAYNTDGSRASVTWTNGTNVVGSWSYGYDAGGRLTSVTSPWNETTTFAYDGEGKLTSQTNPNTTSTVYTYNQQRGWPTGITHKKLSNPFAAYTLAYDNGANTVGLLTGVQEQDGSTVAYGYDGLYRLTSENRQGTNPNQHTFAFDLAGNRTLVDSTAATFDSANKLLATGTTTATHDADGNLTSLKQNNYYPLASFAWDDLGNLTSQSGSGGNYSVSYGYDGFGRRIWSQGYSQPKVWYIFDGDLLLGEVQNPQGYTNPTGFVAGYTWGASGLVSERVSNGSFWYHFGPQGGTRQLTDGSGTVVDAYVYTSWGEAGPSMGGMCQYN